MFLLVYIYKVINFMNSSEINLINKLKELKNIGAVCVKSEFESEGALLADVIKLKNFSQASDLGFNLKIGGCDALKDIYDSEILCVKSITAPMIESEYALNKFVKAVKKVYTDNLPECLINIESITGFNNLETIVKSDNSNSISGIILGRTDMAGSLGFDKNFVNDDKILNIALKIHDICNKNGKKFIIGGGITLESVEFLKQFTNCGFETRKIVFEKIPQSIENAIKKSFEFELLWIEYKKEFYKKLANRDDLRAKCLSNYLK